MICAYKHLPSSYDGSCQDDLCGSYRSFDDLHCFVWQENILLEKLLSDDGAQVSVKATLNYYRFSSKKFSVETSSKLRPHLIGKNIDHLYRCQSSSFH